MYFHQKEFKPLVWNKVHAPWKNAWKLINVPARLFQTLEYIKSPRGRSEYWFENLQRNIKASKPTNMYDQFKQFWKIWDCKNKTDLAN